MDLTRRWLFWSYRSIVGLLAAAGLVLFVLATNRYASPVTDRAIFEKGASDSFSYLAIANSSPNLPAEALPFHHAQRFVLPYVIGLAAHFMSVDVHSAVFVTSGALIVVIVLVFFEILVFLRTPSRDAVLLVALLVLNPWTFRPYLLFPELLNDLGFVFGLAIFLRGLLRGQPAAVIAGQIIASLARQTGLLVVPMGIVWILRSNEWKMRSGAMRIWVSTIIVSVAVGIYLWTSAVAQGFALADENLLHLTNVLLWIASDFDFQVLGEFLILVIASPLIPLVLVAVTNRMTRLRGHSAFLLLGSFCIWTQPILAGPTLTGRNAERLVTLGLLPLLVILGSASARTPLLRRKGLYLIVIGLLAVGSAHHIYAGDLMPFSGNRILYERIFFVTSMLVLLLCTYRRHDKL